MRVWSSPTTSGLLGGVASSLRPFYSPAKAIGDVVNRAALALDRRVTRVLAKDELVTEPRRSVERVPSSSESLAERVGKLRQEHPQTVRTPEHIRVSKCRRYLILHWKDNEAKQNQGDKKHDFAFSDTPHEGMHMPNSTNVLPGASIGSSPSLSDVSPNTSLQRPTRLLAEFLRVYSTSTDVLGSNVLIYGKRGLTFKHVIPQGNYALRLQFSDDHHGTIVPYEMLHQLGLRKFELMRKYVQLLRERRKDRAPPKARAPSSLRPKGDPGQQAQRAASCGEQKTS